MRFKTLFAVAIICFASVATVQATVWDAYTEFNSAENSSANVWSYYRVNEDSNTGYSLLPLYTTFPYTSHNGWVNTGANFPAVGVDGGELKLQPEIDGSASIGWNSPITGSVDASFSVFDLDVGANGAGDHPSVPYDGIGYNLFKGGDATPLATGYVVNGGTSGTISVTGISVAAGDMLYLQVGDGTANNWYDYSGATFTVSEVPEPSTMILLSCGLISLLAYAWRKRR